MKSYTDLQQSKKLAEILPLESADMYYRYNEYEERHYPKVFLDYETAEIRQEVLELKRNDPCWSLAALLSVLPKIGAEEPMVRKLYYANEPKERYICEYSLTNMTSEYDNPVDACYEMVIRLN